jgi:hypothetical protein
VGLGVAVSIGVSRLPTLAAATAAAAAAATAAAAAPLLLHR